MKPAIDPTAELHARLSELKVVACPMCKQLSVLRVIVPWNEAYRFCYVCVGCHRDHSRDLTGSPVVIASVMPPSHKQ